MLDFRKGLTLETVDIQFCSDWLKEEIKKLFLRIKELENEHAVDMETLPKDDSKYGR